MANDINVCTFTGRIGQEPDLRNANGTPVLNITLAVGGSKKVGDAWEDTVEWVPVTIFGKTAEAVAKYKTKGDQLAIVGRFTTRSWEHEGTKRYKSEIIADRVTMLGSKKDSQQPSQSGNTYAAGRVARGAVLMALRTRIFRFNDQCSGGAESRSAVRQK